MSFRIFLLLLLYWGQANAHKPSDSYLTIDTDTWSIRWDVALRDLEFAAGIDRDADGRLTWGELKAQREHLLAYLLPHLDLAADDTPCDLQAGAIRVAQHGDGPYLSLRIDPRCAFPDGNITVRYDLLFDVDPSHRGLLNLTREGDTSLYVFGPDRREQTLSLSPVGGWPAFAEFLKQGIWHIWIGFDHILFLVTLLLPAVLVHRNGAWRARRDNRAAFVDALKTVTAFTLAHSLTLSAAVAGLIHLPSAGVEIAIAVSVVLAAINNLYPLVTRARWLLAFVFGLVHGFGFAGVLLDLGASGSGLAKTLLAFNLGVELGQVAIVCALLPLILAFGKSTIYRSHLYPLCSLSIAAIGTLWVWQRAF